MMWRTGGSACGAEQNPAMRDELVGNLLRRLLDAAERDASLRAALRAAAEGILADLDAIDRRPAPVPAPTPVAPPVIPSPAAPGAGVAPPLAVSPAPAPAPAAAKPPAPPAPRVQTPLRIGDEV